MSSYDVPWGVGRNAGPRDDELCIAGLEADNEFDAAILSLSGAPLVGRFIEVPVKFVAFGFRELFGVIDDGVLGVVGRRSACGQNQRQ